MNNRCLELRKKAQDCLNQMSIMDGDSVINSILFELTETDDTNIDIKEQTLNEIKKLLSVKNKTKIKNDDFYHLKTISEKLRNNIKLETEELNNLLSIIKNNF